MARFSILISFLMANPCYGCVEAYFFDRCTFATEVSGQSKGEEHSVFIKNDETTRQWNFVAYTNNKVVSKGKIAELAVHAHPEVYVTPNGDRFVIFDPYATTRFKNRLMVYDFEGRLIKSYGVNDILKPDELKQITGSRSHLWWIKRDPENRHGSLSDDGQSVRFAVVGGRVVEIPLYKNQ